MQPENKVPPTKQSRLTIINPGVFALTPPDFQRFQSSLRNEFMRRIGDATRFSGKECSINVWMSQKGEVLSARKKSGDEELCSVVLQASKGMRLSPMSNEVYGVFRNPSLNFKF
ncbi:cell envelope integrity TolA C-terminal domain-containing protein [Enterobacter asburiae]|uniref:cell envelope integrity TolA C-terminal domain-containing protein n=1 Tax=Enterobacter asburiae TaxID=61645 RepID=UPI003A0FE5FA